MKKLMLVSILILSIFLQCSKNIQKLIIVETSDVHGTLFNEDFISGHMKARGYVGAKYILDSLRTKYGAENVLYLDCGDLLQGNPLTDYYNSRLTEAPNPMIEALNEMGAEAFVVGNHDIEQGRKVWEKARQDSRFPWLAANVVATASDSSRIFKSYVDIEKNGVRVRIYALITPAIPNWLPPEIYDGLQFKDMVQTVKSDFEEITAGNYNLLIGAFHSGVTPQKGMPDFPAGIPEENAAAAVRDSFPQFDAIFTGHEHKVIPKKVEEFSPGETPLLMPGSKARQVAVLEIDYIRSGRNVTIVKKTAQNIPVPNLKDSSDFALKFSPVKEKISAYVNEEIGELRSGLSAKKSRLQDTKLLDLIHRIQFDQTGAQLSLAASFNTRLDLPAGPVRRKDVFAIYPYENTLYLLKIKGADLIQHLKVAARHYTLQGDSLVINKRVPGYNFDMLDGVNYSLIYRKNGEVEIHMGRLDNGQKFDPEKTYTLAVNSYRAQQLMKQYHCQLLKKTTESMRSLVEQYFLRHKPIDIRANHNWSIKIAG